MRDVPFPRLTYVTCLYKPYNISVRKVSFEASSSGRKCKAKLVVSFSLSGHWEPTTVSWWAVSNLLQLPQATKDVGVGSQQDAGCRSPKQAPQALSQGAPLCIYRLQKKCGKWRPLLGLDNSSVFGSPWWAGFLILLGSTIYCPPHVSFSNSNPSKNYQSI